MLPRSSCGLADAEVQGAGRAAPGVRRGHGVDRVLGGHRRGPDDDAGGGVHRQALGQRRADAVGHDGTTRVAGGVGGDGDVLGVGPGVVTVGQGGGRDVLHGDVQVEHRAPAEVVGGDGVGAEGGDPDRGSGEDARAGVQGEAIREGRADAVGHHGAAAVRRGHGDDGRGLGVDVGVPGVGEGVRGRVVDDDRHGAVHVAVEMDLHQLSPGWKRMKHLLKCLKKVLPHTKSKSGQMLHADWVPELTLMSEERQLKKIGKKLHMSSKEVIWFL